MMGGDDDQPHLPLDASGQDPFLRMQYSALSRAFSRTRQAADPPPEKQPPAKKLKLSSSSSASSAAAAAAKSAKAAKSKGTGKKEEGALAVNHASLLHQSCRLFPNCPPVLESALEMDGPEKACERAASAVAAKSSVTGMSSSYLVGDGREPYSLPINILLQHGASLESIRVLTRAAPKALLMKDGREENCSLNIALRLVGGRSRRNDEDDMGVTAVVNVASTANATVPEELLAANPQAAQVPDRRRNFPLHVACYVGSSFTVINKLYYAYPEALLETNFYGETPLNIAIRNGKCSDITTNFLQEKMDHLKSARMRALRR